MIVIGSRYETADVYATIPPRGSTSTLSAMRPIGFTSASGDATQGVREHIWRAGERLDFLAVKEYGSPTDWWKVLDANREVLNPLDLRPGTRLALP